MSHDPLAWIDDELASLSARALRRERAAREGPQRPGGMRWAGRELLNFSTNDYLGLAADPRLSQAVAAAMPHEAWGAGASPLVTGRGVLHQRLEHELAEFEGAEAALLFSTGYTANVGTVAALAGKGDVIFSDAKNHASLIDGCRLSGATVVVYAHTKVDDLAEHLRAASGYRRQFIVTDTLFSMDGDLAPLPEIAELATEHEAVLVVDEAHATGVFGPHGRGVCEHFGVEEGVPVRIGTLSKALGSAGGFVAGRRSLIELLAHRARSYVFSTAMPAALYAAASAALAIVRNEPQRRRELLARATKLRSELSRQGWNLGASESQIVPLLVGAPQRAMDLAAALRERGCLAPGIRPPSVPEGESLVRLSLSYAHDDAALGRLAGACAELAPEFASAADAPSSLPSLPRATR